MRWVPDWEDGRRWELFDSTGRLAGRVVKFIDLRGYYAGVEGQPDEVFGTMREAAVWLLNSLKAPG